MLVLAAQSKLRGNAKVWADTQIVVHRRWEDFSAQLLLNFPQQQHEADAHITMVNAARKPDETLTAYYHRMCAVGRRGGVSEVASIKYIQNGLRFTSLQNTIAGMSFKNCLDFYSFLSRYEENVPSRNEFVRNVPYKRPRSPTAMPGPFVTIQKNPEHNATIVTRWVIYRSIARRNKDALGVQNVNARDITSENAQRTN